MTNNLPDTQAEIDLRNLGISKVGIRNLECPVRILAKDGEFQHTTAEFSLYGSLSPELKGTNMSRFSQVIHKAIANNPIGLEFMHEVLQIMKTRLESDDVYVKIKFAFFRKKTAPVSKVESFYRNSVIFEGFLKGDDEKLHLTVEGNYTSLCPCSKNMSEKGAHNQRSSGSIKVELKEQEIIWIEDLAEIIDQEGSCEIWNALKRSDEQYVTDEAYNNPKFVEDFVRDVALRVKEFNVPFVIVANNYESIHQSDAVAIFRGGLS